MSFAPRHAGHAEMDMDMGSSNSTQQGGSSMMAMVFQTQTATPLYADAWTPRNSGAYAGTCIFLIVLSVVARLLVALRATQEARWLDHDAQRRYVTARGRVPLAEAVAHDPEAKTMVLSANGAEETVVVVARKDAAARPWRFTVDPVRAVLDTTIVGVGYLLMLAVMTMNVGYFMSVLAGVFLGSLAVGRFGGMMDH
ncbi:Ctr copper transporter [Cordyceps militaris CM01]|uniref:Copper transport protein n=2 Tax=Cordyceps militaris TaxID=73501 RepID=G3J9U6_CORMM|nr:Ctr copper transporter [Cordyceps militaris CM01]ATY61284.1 Ctr copper transporter [Cordyceps militaris]EGX95019.1 Ctr copper transporter [Cordyceps militaris CM01]